MNHTELLSWADKLLLMAQDYWGEGRREEAKQCLHTAELLYKRDGHLDALRWVTGCLEFVRQRDRRTWQ
jgi:hypothetical protein